MPTRSEFNPPVIKRDGTIDVSGPVRLFYGNELDDFVLPAVVRFMLIQEQPAGPPVTVGDVAIWNGTATAGGATDWAKNIANSTPGIKAGKLQGIAQMTLIKRGDLRDPDHPEAGRANPAFESVTWCVDVVAVDEPGGSASAG